MQTEKNQEQQYKERVIRILAKDIEGGMKVYPGLTKIKGVSWGLSRTTI